MNSCSNFNTDIFISIFPAGQLHFISIFKHAIAALYVVANLFITDIPIRILHFWQPLILGLIYIKFSVIYDVLFGGTNTMGHPYIYSSLDWSGGTTKAMINSMLAIFTLFIVWLFLYGLYKLRVHLQSHCGFCNHDTASQNNADTET